MINSAPLPMSIGVLREVRLERGLPLTKKIGHIRFLYSREHEFKADVTYMVINLIKVTCRIRW